uniref:TSC22 domain family protein 3 n=2 Tax=Felinae TaxID=338152 RepID=A0ABI7YWR7_FELCA
APGHCSHGQGGGCPGRSFALYLSFLSLVRVACPLPPPATGLTKARLPPFHPGTSEASGGSWRVGRPFAICRAPLHKSENPTTEDQGATSSEPLVNSSAMSASGASVVAIDNKIEQAMDLVKNHLMYAVREEVEILKEQIRELVEKNSQLERENTLLKTLASPEQLEKFQSRLSPEEPVPETPHAPEAPGGSAV